jgi:hypothetical protein
MHAHYLTRACAWELEDRVAYRELRAETRKSQLLIASVNREEVKRRGDPGLCHSREGTVNLMGLVALAPTRRGE